MRPFRALHAASAVWILLALSAASGAAQQAAAPVPPPGVVTGVVSDSASGEPVVAAVVRLVQAHRADRTHDGGQFVFRDVPAGSYTVIVQRIGYRQTSRSIRVEPGGTQTLNVALTAAVVQLGAQVVTGTIGAKRGDEVLSPSAVVEGADLDRAVRSTVGASVQNTPGVSVTSIGPATARPVIRGLGGDRILVLEDGQRTGDLSSFSGDHAVTIDPLSANQIEVVRGPMSLMFGSSALGGVVNVVRDEVPTSLPEDLHGVFGAQVSSVDRGAATSLSTSSKVGNVALKTQATARHAGETQTPIGPLVHTGLDSYAGTLGAAYIGTSSHAGGAYTYYNNAYGIPGGFVGAHPTGVDIKMRRHSGRVEAERHLNGPLSSVSTTGTLIDYSHEELERSGAVGTRFGETMATLEMLVRQDSVGRFSQGAFGVRGQYRDIVTGGTLRTPPTTDYSGALFGIEEIGFGAVRLQGGLRYDWSRYTPNRATTIFVGGQNVPVRQRSFGSASGSLGLLWSITPELRAGSSVSRAYRTPDFNELYSNGPHLAANSFEVGDPNLRQETGIGVDAYVRYTNAQVQGEVAAFHNALYDFIYPSSRGRAEIGLQGNRPRFQFTNGDVVFDGGEGSVEVSVTPRVAVRAVASSVFARFTSELAPVPIIGVADTTFVAASKYPPFIPPVNGHLEVRYETPTFFAGSLVRLSASQARLGDFEDPSAGYAVFGFDTGVRLMRGRGLHTITLRVDNAADREYRNHLSRTKAIMPEPGRDVSLVYRLSF